MWTDGHMHARPHPTPTHPPRAGVPVGVDAVRVEHLAPQRRSVAVPHVRHPEPLLAGDHTLSGASGVGHQVWGSSVGQWIV